MTHNPVPLAAVLGHPVIQSKSPRLHNHWLKTLGHTGYYSAIDTTPEEFSATIRHLQNLGFRGANVTMPHKEAALAIADETSNFARRVGAANTLVFRADGTIHADNTDGYGFVANLRDGAPHWQGNARHMVLGAGGAARAIVAALLDEGGNVVIVNRTLAKAETIAELDPTRVTVTDWDNVDLSTTDTLINTTSLGMKGQGDIPLDLSTLCDTAIVTDIVYSPLETPLLKQAAARGLTTVDGLGMLLWQARPGFQAWFGQEPPDIDTKTRQMMLA